MQPLENDDPSAIGPYRLVARLGAGGMGRVYLARSAGGRTVAVKVVRAELADNPDFRARFRREVAAAQSVDGAYTAPVVDADRDSATPWLATAYVLGPSLAEAVAAHGPLPERSVRALGAVLAEALTAIHGAGLVHRDLKPSNVLLAADGPRVIDFGIARALDGGSLTSTGVIVGSPGFMSPEQASGRPVGAPGDVFSLGSVLAFAATGQGPFGQDSAASMLYRVVHDVPDLTLVPAGLREAVHACLAKDPADRPTPQALLGLLAPEGAAELLRGAWLPAEVASGIAQHAALVMELETPAPHNPAPAGDGGTVVLGGGRAAPEPTPTPTPTPDAAVPAAAGPSRRKVLYGALGLAAVVAAGGGTALTLGGGDGNKPKPGPAKASGSATPSPSMTFPSRAPGVPPQPVWTYSADHAVDSPVLAADGVVLIAASDLVAVDARGGKALWTGPALPPSTQARPYARAGGVVVALSDQGALVGLSPDKGAQLWSLDAPPDLRFNYLLAANDHAAFLLTSKYKLDAKGQPIIVLGQNDLAVSAVDLRTRKVLWTRLRNAKANENVLGFATDAYLVYTNDQNNVVVRATSDGAQLWSQNFGEPGWAATTLPLLGGDTVYLPGPNVLGYGLAKGERRYTSRKAPKGSFLGLAYADGTVFASNLGGHVVEALDAHGNVAWQADAPPGIMGEPLCVVGDTVFSVSIVGNDGSEGVTALDRTTGKVLWTFQDGGQGTDDWWLSTDGTLLYAAHGPHVHALPPR